jgi:hypothetical protein
MKQAHDNALLTSFALNELEGLEAERCSLLVEQDITARERVEDVRKVSTLIERALRMEAEGLPPMAKRPQGRILNLIAPLTAAAAAAFVLVFGLPQLHQKKEGFSVTVETDAFAATFSPGVDKEAIRQIVQSHLQEVKKCYEDGLITQPSMAGKLLVHFSFGESGVVSEASVRKSTLGSPAVANCIADRVKSWKFPNAQKDVKAVVEYPFIFSAK